MKTIDVVKNLPYRINTLIKTKIKTKLQAYVLGFYWYRYLQLLQCFDSKIINFRAPPFNAYLNETTMKFSQKA